MQLSRLSKLIFISFLFCWSNTQAAPRWWDKFINGIVSTFTPVTTPTYYFGDPNNTGINGGWTHTPNYMKFLPPYNRKVGRGPLGTEANCLYQFPLPGESGNTTHNAFGTITNMCAEDPGNNSVKHKIKIRNVTCLFAGCFYQQFELNALKSECRFTVGLPLGSMQYILPFVTRRVCARIASPPGDGYAADPGYMQGTDSAGRARGQHLDNYGVTQWDDLVTDQDNNQYAIFRPKICAYDDPWALDIWILGDKAVAGGVTAMQNLIDGKGSLSDFLQVPLDLFDLNPVSQPFHGGSGVTSPVASLLITLLQFYITYQTIGPQIMQSIILMLISMIKSPGAETAGEVLATIYKIGNFILTYQASTILLILQANSQVNKYSYSNYGCVNLPLGDYPPNYCPTSASIVTGLLDSICSTDSSGNLYQNCYGSTSTQTGQTTPYTLCTPTKCVQSNYDNNFLNNTVRIGYTHPVQICSTNLTTNCVNISSSLTRTSAMQNSNFILGSGLSLVNVGNATISSTKQYRVLYQVLNADQTNIIEISNYFYVDLPDCGGATNGYLSPTGASVIQSTQFCQSIWGVDLGEYSDTFNILVTPTTTSPTGPLSTSSNPVSLSYTDLYSGQSFNNKFYVQIDQNTDDYENICAYQMYDLYPDSQIGCVLRSSMPTPSISSCSSSTHTSPCATVNWSIKGKTGTNYTASATMTVPQFTSDWSSLPSDPVIYIGGSKFSTHVVDTNNLTIPYQPSSSSDSRIVNLSGTNYYDSIWGNYLNNIMPSSSCDQDTCAVYINGLEYIGGHYVRGGSYLCIDNLNGCEGDTTQCILAKNYTTPDNSATWTSISPSDRISPNTTSTSLTSAQYYSYDETASIPSGQSVRSKIGLENTNMCVTIPSATCSASTDADTYYSDWSSGTSYYYKATWPASSSTGQLATGTCSSNYIAVDSSKMSRYCLLKSTGETSWDTNNTRLSSTFSGCVPSCINTISVSPTTGSTLTGGGSITVSNTSASTKSADGGNLLIYSTGGAGTNGISGSGTNTITISFNLPYTTSQADIYFTSLQFADYMQISVNGTQITTDSSNIAYNSTNYVLWNSATSPSDVGGWRNYTTLDSNLSNLNASLLSNLRTGSNTITINVKTVSGGGFYIGLAYNQLCYTQCSSDGAGYATWTKAAVGGISVGTCNSGYAAYDSSKMTRYCSLSSSSGVLDSISTGTSTVSGTSSNSSAGTSFGGCVYGSCSAVSTASSSSGNAKWTLASYGAYSAGTCDTNYITNDTTKMKRLCTIVSNNVDLEAIQSNGKTSSGNFAGCTLGSCSAVTTASSSTGNATWGQANAGSLSQGSCASGYVSADSTKMTRACTVSNNVASLDTISNGTSSNSTYGASFGGCVAGVCGAVTTASSSTGNATWSGPTSPGSLSTGTCGTNYVANNTSKMTRACTIANNSASLDTISNGISSNTTYSASFAGCSLGSCANDSAGYATWTAVSAGQTSLGTCNSGYSASGTMTRYCQVNRSTNSSYLDTVSTGDGIDSGTSSNSSAGASFQGCIADRIKVYYVLATNYSYTGCMTDIKTSTSGTDYYVSFNTCYASSTATSSGNGIYSSSGVENVYYIRFYVPTAAAKSTVSLTQLNFNDYVRVIVYPTDSAGNASTSYQVTSDNAGVPYNGVWSVLWTSSNIDLGGWRDYSNGQSISDLSSAIQSKLQVGWNLVEVRLRTYMGGGIYFAYKFANPSKKLSWTGTYTTPSSPTWAS